MIAVGGADTVGAALAAGAPGCGIFSVSPATRFEFALRPFAAANAPIDRLNLRAMLVSESPRATVYFWEVCAETVSGYTASNAPKHAAKKEGENARFGMVKIKRPNES